MTNRAIKPYHQSTAYRTIHSHNVVYSPIPNMLLSPPSARFAMDKSMEIHEIAKILNLVVFYL